MLVEPWVFQARFDETSQSMNSPLGREQAKVLLAVSTKSCRAEGQTLNSREGVGRGYV